MNSTTDRAHSDLSQARFYGILDSGYVSREAWQDKYEALVRGGSGIVQIRAKKQSPRERRELLELALERRETLGSSAPRPPIVINDDLELCLRYPGLGLHVGQDDLPAAEARQRLGPDRILGLSTHSPAQVAAAIALGENVLSYFAVGPVFSTQTKPDYIPVGLQLVQFASNQATPLPIFFIGGINRGNIAQVRAAGAKRIVTVSDVLQDSDTASAVRRSIELVTGAAE